MGSGALNFSSSGASVTGSSDETRKLINHYNTQLKGIGINCLLLDLELRLNNVIKDSVQKYAEIEYSILRVNKMQKQTHYYLKKKMIYATN